MCINYIVKWMEKLLTYRAFMSVIVQCGRKGLRFARFFLLDSCTSSYFVSQLSNRPLKGGRFWMRIRTLHKFHS